MAYEIYIYNETAEDSASPVAGGQGASSPKQASSDASAGLKGLVVYNKLKPYIKQGIQHQINTVELRTGAAELQQRLQFGYQIASDLFGIGESIAIGALMGNIPGAIAGAVVGVFNTVIGYSYKQNTIDLQESREDIALSLMDRRAAGSIATYNQSRGVG